MKIARHKFRAPVHQLIDVFERAHASDKGAEKRLRFWTPLATGALALGILAVVVGGFIEVALVMGAGGLCILASVVLFVIRARIKAYDLEDRKLDAVLNFLHVIAADTPQQAPLSVEVDFRNHLKGGQLINRGKVGGGLFSVGARVKKYQHPWLKIAGLLADGNRYQIEVCAHVTRREKPKRKYTKVRERKTESLRITLRAKRAVYGGVENAAALLLRTAPPGGLQLKKVTGRNQSLYAVLLGRPRVTVHNRNGLAVASQGQEISGDNVLTSLLWAYHGISRARRQAG